MLVADIERGGVFGSVLGTIGLLTPDERALLRGFAINRFRGDVSLFEEGARTLEARTGSHCFGVFPYAADITIDAEDSLALDTEPRVLAPAGARIAIVRLPCMSNATDFRLLPWADWIQSPPAGDYDFVVLPGTKNSIGDLRWLHSTGLSAWMLGQRRRGATIVGICGGYQMMGRRIEDPLGVEGGGSAAGLGLLPVVTVMKPEKRTEVRSATTRGGRRFTGYEIHMGETSYEGSPQPFARFDDGTADGACLPGAIGTYLHGALENPDVCAELFGVPIAAVPKRDHYERLATWLERHGRQLERLLAG
jgi:adenosylcobyric acid synthase